MSFCSFLSLQSASAMYYLYNIPQAYMFVHIDIFVTWDRFYTQLAIRTLEGQTFLLKCFQYFGSLKKKHMVFACLYQMSDRICLLHETFSAFFGLGDFILHDFRLPPRRGWGVCSSGMLRNVYWYLPTFQEIRSVPYPNGAETLSRNVSDNYR